MFARDVISQQAMEKCLLEEMATPVMAFLPAEEEMTPECAEEFEQTCRSVAPLSLLASLDLHEQFKRARSTRF